MILPIVWGLILGFVIIMYVILDGFDLGVGILYPWVNSNTHRDIMMTTISPVWDGNETWLVLGGACLYGAFPVVYSTLLPIFYLPIMLMLAALILRGIAFEFRFKAHKSRFIWDIAFTGGSMLAAFTQGLILGTYIDGVELGGPEWLAANPYFWLSPFSIVTGIAVIFGYSLLGSTWLIGKTTGDLQQKMYRAAQISLIAVAFFLVVVSLWTPFLDPHIKQRWFSIPNIFYLSFLPIITGLLTIYLWVCLQRKREWITFFLSICLFLLSYAGLAISIWPFIIPHKLTLWQAAAPLNSQIFILVGVVILLPVLLGYTMYSYLVFRGKVTSKEHAHY